MKFRFTTLVLLVACACMPILAQPVVEITIAERPAADSVVDFGVTFVGNHTRRALAIRNLGADTAVVLTNDIPFVEFSNLPWIPSDDPRYQNFVVDNTFPIVVAPGQVARVDLRYLARAEPPIALDSAVEAQMRIRVVRSFEPTGPFAERQFRLRGRRTTQYLVTGTPIIRFDSVYVNLNRRLQETFRVRNLQTESVAIEKQTLEIKTTVIGDPEISVDVKPSVIVGGLDSAFWDVYYQPRNLGYDSAVFTLQYRLDTTSGPVTLDTKISGVGVEQRLRIVDVQSEQATSGLRWSGDTVDFGTVGSAQDTVRAMIIVENVGNLDPVVLLEQKRILPGGVASDTASFQIRRTVAEGSQILRRGARDTIVVTYAPTAAGESAMRYAITTDILSRGTIKAVPFGAEVMSFAMIGRQRRARITVEPAEIIFDTIAYSPVCTSTTRDSMRVTNTGDLDLRITAIRSRSGSLAVTASPQALTIAPQQSAFVTLDYRPTSEGSIIDTLDIVSNALQQNIVGVPFQATALRMRDTMLVRMPDTIAARPGFDNVVVDVAVSPALVGSFERCTLAIDVDTTVLRFERAISLGTATEIAGAPERLPADGHSLRLAWTAPDQFEARPVFTRLVFSAMLGASLDSPLGVSSLSTTFGTVDCPDLVPVRSASGVFRIDSLCGLTYKTAIMRNQAMAGVFPNPVVDRGTLTVLVPRHERVRAVCVDAFGRERMVIVDDDLAPGSYAVDIGVESLPPAAYSVIVWSSQRYIVVPFVVGR